MSKRILVPFDGSDHARQALTDTVELARAGDGKLTVLSVSLPIAAWVSGAGLAPSLTMDEVQQQVNDVFWTELNEAGEMIPGEVDSTSTLRIGDAATEILGQVRSGAHDLVFIGSRGRVKVEASGLGGVSQQVSQSCPVPVLTVHGKESVEVDPRTKPASAQNGDRPHVIAG